MEAKSLELQGFQSLVGEALERQKSCSGVGAEVDCVSLLTEELTTMKDKMFPLIADVKNVEECNTVMESKVSCKGDAWVVSENRGDSLKAELLPVKNYLAKARVENANLWSARNYYPIDLKHV